MFSIKREKWGGLILKDKKGKIISKTPAKFISVSRNGKGRLISWERWSSKRPITRLREIAKQHGGTFKKGFDREEMVNVVEISDFSRKPSKPTSGKYQYVVSIMLKSGKEISARSKNHDVDFPLSKAREEAIERAYGRLTYEVLGVSDSNKGQSIIDDNKLRVKEGVVYYKSK